MHKIKIKNNKVNNITSFDLNIQLLENNRLYNICNLFQLKELYIDIYSIEKTQLNFAYSYMSNSLNPSDFKIFNENCMAIKTTVKHIPIIVDLLRKIRFDDLTVWNQYTNWEQHLVDKECFEKKEQNPTERPVFYLCYNLHEGNKTEIICCCDKKISLLHTLQNI